MSFRNDRRKSDDRPIAQQQPAEATLPSSLRRFENQILTLVDVWAYPSGNAWLLHDDGTIVEIPKSTSAPTEDEEDLGQIRHTHMRLPLVGQWSIVVGGISKHDTDRFSHAVHMLARMARQQGELDATASVAMETSDEVETLQQLISLPIKSLERTAVLDYLAQTVLTTARSAAALLIDEDATIATAGTPKEVALLREQVSATATAAIVRSEEASTSFDYMTKRIADGKVLVAIAGLPGVHISSSQLRGFDHAASHADGLLRLSDLAERSPVGR